MKKIPVRMQIKLHFIIGTNGEILANDNWHWENDMTKARICKDSRFRVATELQLQNLAKHKIMTQLFSFPQNIAKIKHALS